MKATSGSTKLEEPACALAKAEAARQAQAEQRASTLAKATAARQALDDAPLITVSASALAKAEAARQAQAEQRAKTLIKEQARKAKEDERKAKEDARKAKLEPKRKAKRESSSSSSSSDSSSTSPAKKKPVQKTRTLDNSTSAGHSPKAQKLVPSAQQAIARSTSEGEVLLQKLQQLEAALAVLPDVEALQAARIPILAEIDATKKKLSAATKLSTQASPVCPHGHALSEVGASNGWFCNGGCKRRGEATHGLQRWRCKKCDYDLCPHCVAAKSVSPQEKIAESEGKAGVKRKAKTEGKPKAESKRKAKAGSVVQTTQESVEQPGRSLSGKQRAAITPRSGVRAAGKNRDKAKAPDSEEDILGPDSEEDVLGPDSEEEKGAMAVYPANENPICDVTKVVEDQSLPVADDKDKTGAEPHVETEIVGDAGGCGPGQLTDVAGNTATDVDSKVDDRNAKRDEEMMQEMMREVEQESNEMESAGAQLKCNDRNAQADEEMMQEMLKEIERDAGKKAKCETVDASAAGAATDKGKSEGKIGNEQTGELLADEAKRNAKDAPVGTQTKKANGPGAKPWWLSTRQRLQSKSKSKEAGTRGASADICGGANTDDLTYKVNPSEILHKELDPLLAADLAGEAPDTGKAQAVANGETKPISTHGASLEQNLKAQDAEKQADPDKAKEAMDMVLAHMQMMEDEDSDDEEDEEDEEDSDEDIDPLLAADLAGVAASEKPPSGRASSGNDAKKSAEKNTDRTGHSQGIKESKTENEVVSSDAGAATRLVVEATTTELVKPKDLNKPPKPLLPFDNFSDNQKAKILEENAALTEDPEALKVAITEAWTQVPSERKDELQAHYDTEKQNWEELMAEYKKSENYLKFSQELSAYEDRKKHLKKQSRKTKHLEAFYKEVDEQAALEIGEGLRKVKADYASKMPGKPPSNILSCYSEATGIKGNMGQLSARFKVLPKEDKDKYTQLVAQRQAKYKEEQAKYYASPTGRKHLKAEALVRQRAAVRAARQKFFRKAPTMPLTARALFAAANKEKEKAEGAEKKRGRPKKEQAKEEEQEGDKESEPKTKAQDEGEEEKEKEGQDKHNVKAKGGETEEEEKGEHGKDEEKDAEREKDNANEAAQQDEGEEEKDQEAQGEHNVEAKDQEMEEEEEEGENEKDEENEIEREKGDANPKEEQDEGAKEEEEETEAQEKQNLEAKEQEKEEEEKVEHEKDKEKEAEREKDNANKKEEHDEGEDEEEEKEAREKQTVEPKETEKHNGKEDEIEGEREGQSKGKRDRERASEREKTERRQWDRLSDEERKRWEDEHAAQALEYAQKMEDFKKTEDYKKYEETVEKAHAAMKTYSKKGMGGGAKTKAKGKVPKPVGQPEKPLIAYKIFAKDQKGTSTSAIAQQWKELGTEGQKTYIEQAASAMKAFTQQMAVWQKSKEGTKYSKTIAAQKQKDKDEKAKAKHLVGADAPEAPERPPNARALFEESKRSELLQCEPELTPKDITRRCGELWKKLDAAGREPHEARAQSFMDAYEFDMQEYQQTPGYKKYLQATGRGKPKAKASASGKGRKSSGRGPAPKKVKIDELDVESDDDCMGEESDDSEMNFGEESDGLGELAEFL